MADIKISALPTDTAIDPADLIPFVDVSASRTESTTVEDLASSSAFTSQFAPLRFARYGSGSPQSSVTGSVGDRYIDTAATIGGHIWRKATGTDTNTGWVIEVGDTGWRDMSSFWFTGWSNSSDEGVFAMRRIGQEVFYVLKGDMTAGNNSTFSSALPTSFAPARSNGITEVHLGSPGWYSTVAGDDHPTTPVQVWYDAAGRLRCGSLPDPCTFNTAGSFVTDAVWPIAYPGASF